ncbi:DUF2278 family protein [Kribbella pittospori]|uniref:DUF2278 family protein n=1 Tax=Kribbella pittospori TaxID=722689 RepID=A0A4R0KRX5_9ACTN|nr:DUF2278 family protein [Kribbella pittospori]TCC63150.1 DUF2278 family protein [Kribbella pittospori]
MPLKTYGVLVGRAVGVRREGDSDTPHYQIRLVDDARVDYRIAVNVKSKEFPSELLYRVHEDFRHPVTAQLIGLARGWHRLDTGAAGVNLDYVRQTLFDRTLLRPLPADVEGPGNDLADLLDDQVQRAIREPAAVVYAFGERWGPEDGVPDKVFGFRPGNGVHDIHMNQGNVGAFRKDDGVWQDGAIIIGLPDQQRWVGIFLAFQSQSWHTDDKTGHALVDAPVAEFGAEAVQIVAALINPVGPAPEAETVTLLNASPDAVDLTGWHLVDRALHVGPVPAGVLPPGETLLVRLPSTVQLGNKGGEITLLNSAGLKVHGVAYTAAQAERSGWSVVF